MDPTYHMMSMLQTIEALPAGWLENTAMRRMRLMSGLLGIIFLGVSVVCLIFLFVDFHSMGFRVFMELGASRTGDPRLVAKALIVAAAVVSFLLSVFCFLVDFLGRAVQRRNRFILALKNNIRDFSRSYEPEAVAMEL